MRSTTSRAKSFVGLTLCFAAAVGAYFYFANKDIPKNEADDEQSVSIPSAADHQQSSVVGELEHSTLSNNDKESSPEHPVRKRWYLNPDFESEGKFAQPEIQTTWNASCTSAPSSDLVTFLRDEAGLNGKDHFPRSAHIDEFSQFWKAQNRFFQYRASWNKTFPPTYRVRLISAATSDFNTEFKKKSSFDGFESVDIETALTFVESQLQQAKQNSLQMGARIVSMRTAPASDDKRTPWHNALYLNGVPVRYEQGKVVCSTNLESLHAECDCNATL